MDFLATCRSSGTFEKGLFFSFGEQEKRFVVEAWGPSESSKECLGKQNIEAYCFPKLPKGCAGKLRFSFHSGSS